MAETGVWGPCVLPTHARSTAASTVDADIMLSMTSAVARHCISPRCSWDRPAGLVHPDARRRHSVDGTECRHRESGCTRPAQRSQLHRSTCSAHGTLTQAPRGVVPEPGTRATGRVLCSAGHGHRVLSIPVQDRPRGRSDRPYRGSGRPYSENRTIGGGGVGGCGRRLRPEGLPRLGRTLGGCTSRAPAARSAGVAASAGSPRRPLRGRRG